MFTRLAALGSRARFITFAVLLAACKDQAPEPPSVTGNWHGTLSGSQLTLTLVQNGSSVTGNGSFAASGGSAALTVTSGTYLTPTLSITLTPQQFEQFNVTAHHSGNTLSGVANGSGFQNAAVSLQRP